MASPSHTSETSQQTSPTNPSVGGQDAAFTKLIREELDRNNKYLEFSQGQIERDRSFYKHLYTFAGAFLAFMVAVASYFQYASISQMRSDIKTSVEAELQKGKAELAAFQAESRLRVATELTNVRTEVTKRVEAEFKNENITSLVSKVARERTNNELEAIIRSEASIRVAQGLKDQSPTIRKNVEDETRSAVRSLEPTISGIVKGELEEQVRKSVAPVEAQMKSYGELVAVGSISQLAKYRERKGV